MTEAGYHRTVRKTARNSRRTRRVQGEKREDQEEAHTTKDRLDRMSRRLGMMGRRLGKMNRRLGMTIRRGDRLGSSIRQEVHRGSLIHPTGLQDTKSHYGQVQARYHQRTTMNGLQSLGAPGGSVRTAS